MQLSNYHSHCTFCDGRSIPEDFVRFAITHGFRAYGFSSHSPLPFETFWNMSKDDMPEYLQEIKRLKQKYSDQLEIYAGLEIDYLNKEPGIYSARYMGEDTSYHIKNANLIERLDGVEDEKRTARFVCVIAAVCPDGSEHVTRGTIEGRIGYEEKGENGFGYDPIFYLPQYGKYSAELSSDEKNAISHRGEALRRIREVL